MDNNKATCRGCYALGTACGHCSKCLKDPNRPKEITGKPYQQKDDNMVQYLQVQLGAAHAIINDLHGAIAKDTCGMCNFLERGDCHVEKDRLRAEVKLLNARNEALKKRLEKVACDNSRERDQLKEHIKKLGKRIHNQRVQLRDTWEIMEDRWLLKGKHPTLTLYLHRENRKQKLRIQELEGKEKQVIEGWVSPTRGDHNVLNWEAVGGDNYLVMGRPTKEQKTDPYNIKVRITVEVIDDEDNDDGRYELGCC